MLFEEIVQAAEHFKSDNELYFILDNIVHDQKWKNGVLLKGLFAQLLILSRFWGGSTSCAIGLFDKARHISKLKKKWLNYFIQHNFDAENRVMIITHCFAEERAIW